MTDPINTYTRPLGSQSLNGSRSAARQEASKGASEAGAPVSQALDNAPRLAQGEQLQLSETARRSMADPGFDRAKVDAIKAALREGNYPLDSRKIAESFVALERMIDD
ncbi:MAG: flagellar biosynthesis anti-sigma factor FlgM [Betaproteobacteria bacterium]|jgi:negative regulator of flagellin synthesis FlgM|nr:flagellar biosynthesis anti-sigma factor FlgM [Betaproteobacteria bacterium]NBT10800.1 flagellar biosynthesis anti-sigma factor FlgM [Betaproteobacteria bacterium]NBU50659.1 flagellar biosynthesis anti-sigma factor FlgM [Betaproteobacteria bacterium]